VVSAPVKPEKLMDGFKAYATRKLRRASLMSEKLKPWARHGSTEYLWTEDQLHRAIDYVISGQGAE
jgi:hypothetical protein